jgi:hypothetical protein
MKTFLESFSLGSGALLIAVHSMGVVWLLRSRLAAISLSYKQPKTRPRIGTKKQGRSQIAMPPREAGTKNKGQDLIPAPSNILPKRLSVRAFPHSYHAGAFGFSEGLG